MIYTIDELKEMINPVAEKYNLRAVYLFGSYARSEATDDSDVDIVIDRTGSTVKGIIIGGLYNDLCENIKKQVDLITTHMLEQESTKRRSPFFAENVKKEMVKVYG